MIKTLCYLVFKLSGWRFKSDIPDSLTSFVFIGAPHTSNFDFIPAMSVCLLMKRNSKFVIKKEWLKFPFSLILGPAGAIGLDRNKIKSHKNSNTTDVMAELFKDIPDLVLMISPEGTRSPNENWKTGFFYIAKKANVPIVLGFADYDKKLAGIGPIIYPNDLDECMTKIMNFYKDIKGRVPDKFKLDSKYSNKK